MSIFLLLTLHLLFSPAQCAKRERLDGEIVPVSAAQSRTLGDDEEEYGAYLAIDLDLEINSHTTSGKDGKRWLKITLDQVHCVEQVMYLFSSGNPLNTWTCSIRDCSTCEGSYKFCSSFTLTVYTEGAAPDNLSPESNYGCKYGDTVKLEAIDNFIAYEIVIIGKQGCLKRSVAEQKMCTHALRAHCNCKH
ncbi:uncharacterized protein LOC134825662 [Bolinopsis microptera]|uniref:uncharacterized protein LOC134825662 n=1 Tax=Bolinopsis microptera TaxID=2820187 RepID=UPI0030795D37